MQFTVIVWRDTVVIAKLYTTDLIIATNFATYNVNYVNMSAYVYDTKSGRKIAVYGKDAKMAANSEHTENPAKMADDTIDTTGQQNR
jgi:Na+-transporting NADH:ubiquinone oxidoreductase subunit NqrF